MGPAQPAAGGGEKKKITLEQLIAQSEQDGFEIEGKPEAAKEMSMEEKVGALVKGTGGMPQQENSELTPEQQAILENQYRQDLKMKILETEKELRMKHPEASESQLWEAANAFLQGDVIGVSEIMGKMYQTASDKEKEQANKDMDLHLEAESGGGDQKGETPLGLGDIFSPGGTLDASFSNRS